MLQCWSENLQMQPTFIELKGIVRESKLVHVAH